MNLPNVKKKKDSKHDCNSKQFTEEDSPLVGSGEQIQPGQLSLIEWSSPVGFTRTVRLTSLRFGLTSSELVTFHPNLLHFTLMIDL